MAQLYTFYLWRKRGEKRYLLLYKVKGLSLQVEIKCIAPKEECPEIVTEILATKPNSHILFSLYREADSLGPRTAYCSHIKAFFIIIITAKYLVTELCMLIKQCFEQKY